MIFSLSNLFGLHKGQSPTSEKSHEVASTYIGKHLGAGGPNQFRRLGANSSPFGGNTHFTRSASSTLLESTPFAPVTKRSTGLTLGDILPQIPQETLGKITPLPNLPLHFAKGVLEEALRQPQPAIPLFEVFRACPRIFKTSVSHQDSRNVSIPDHMLAYLTKSIQEHDLPSQELQKGTSPFQIAKDVVSLFSQPFAERENLGNHFQMVLPVKKVTKRLWKAAPSVTKIPESVQQAALALEAAFPEPQPIEEVPQPPVPALVSPLPNVRPKRRLCTVSHMNSQRKTKLAAIMEQYTLVNC